MDRRRSAWRLRKPPSSAAI